MTSVMELPFVDSQMTQPTMEMPVDYSKDILTEPNTKVEEVISTRIHQVVVHDDEDDDCVICYSTLYRPVKTECRHTACEGCMLHWALAAMDGCADHSELPSDLTVDGINFKCPTCRTYTTATFDAEFNARLQTRYPEEYAIRAAEQPKPEDDQQDEHATRTMLVMLGNSHRKVEPTISPYTGIMRHHEWTLFLKSSQLDLIEKVEVILHPTYREDRHVVLREPPFSLTHKAWGYFDILAGVKLKEGYEWVDEERAVDKARNGVKDSLPLEWLLDFHGNGSQANRLIKYRKVRPQPEKLDEDTADLNAMAEFMTEEEIEELREVRRLKRLARRMHETLESSEA